MRKELEKPDPEGPGSGSRNMKGQDPFGWISLLAIAIALHGYHQGFQPVYPGDLIALAVIGLLLVYCIRGQRQLSGEESAGERLALRLGQALRRIIRP
jgi:hypothetical protein